MIQKPETPIKSGLYFALSNAGLGRGVTALAGEDSGLLE